MSCDCLDLVWLDLSVKFDGILITLCHDGHDAPSMSTIIILFV